MKLELSDGLSNNSDFSNDSQISQMSTTNSTDFGSTISNGTTIITTSFISLDGLSSGVPTQTTPTLTPTTLRNIEQTFIELQSSEAEQRDQAGFVPPIVIGNNQYISSTISSSDTEISNKSMWTNSDSSGASIILRPTPPVTPQDALVTPVTTTTTTTTTGGRRNGGRRPTKNINMTPEEEQRRNLRRERNKIAAARCRKRRLDHTNALLQETEGLEEKKKALQNEIDELQATRDELQYVLDRHRAACRMQQAFNGLNGRPDSPPDIKPTIYHLIDQTDPLNSVRIKEEIDVVPTTTDNLLDDGSLLFTQPTKKPLLSNNNTTTLNAINTTPVTKPNRPSSLNVPGAFIPKTTAASSSVEMIAGVPITTPSAGIPFNFDSLMEGGTGLTPVSGPLIPSCSSQQRNGSSNMNASGDLITPDSNIPSKLVSL